MLKQLSIFVLILCVQANIFAQIYQWRGADRSAVYPDKNLRDTWPAEGLSPVLSIEGIGFGYGSPTVTETHIYIAGMIDSMGYVFCFDRNGNKCWQTEYGTEFTYKFLGSRGTPTLENDRLYYAGSYGDVVCLDCKTGSVIWKINSFDLYGGAPIKWGYTESPLLYEDLIILTPGGDDHNIVALNKTNAKLVWRMNLKNNVNAYCSPVIIKHNKQDMIMLNTSNAIVLFDPKTGKPYITHELTNSRLNHSIAPIYKNGQLFYSSGYGEGAVMFKVNDTNRKLDTLWTNKDFDCKLSGLIEHKGQIYGTSDKKKQWMSVSWDNGETLFSTREIKSGSFAMADNKLYIFTETGQVVLAHPSDSGFSVTNTFYIPEETVTMSFAHPVIFDSKLWVRYDNTLWVYDISY